MLTNIEENQFPDYEYDRESREFYFDSNEREKNKNNNFEKIIEINNDFMRAFQKSNLFQNEKELNNLDDIEIIDSKNSTNSQLTNDDSFEDKFISDGENKPENIYINKKRIRSNKKSKKNGRK